MRTEAISQVKRGRRIPGFWLEQLLVLKPLVMTGNREKEDLEDGKFLFEDV
jgi:hypothetical protein